MEVLYLWVFFSERDPFSSSKQKYFLLYFLSSYACKAVRPRAEGINLHSSPPIAGLDDGSYTVLSGDAASGG